MEAVIATSRPMMLANLANAVALILVELHVGELSIVTSFWALIIAAYAISGWRRASEFGKAPRRPIASTRAPGKIILSSLVLAILWCYPIVFILPNGSTIEIAFVSALSSGMVAGGALALYPVPLAGIVYVSVLWIAAFSVILFSGVLPAPPFAIVTAAFAYVVLHSMRRHAGMFLSELVEKLQAQRQSDITNLLMDAYQGAGGHYLWRCDQAMRMATDPAPLRKMLGISDEVSPDANLLELLAAGDAKIAKTGPGTDTVPLTSQLHELFVANQHFEVRLKLDDNRTVEFVGRPEALTGGYWSGFHGYLKDITQETRSAERIELLTSLDAPTGLLNYREFRDRADTMFQLGQEQGASFVFLFLDADNLKSINDNFGHAVGDRLILEIAMRLGAFLPQDSLIGRKGGDEFVALLPYHSEARLREWSKDLLNKICGAFSAEGQQYSVSCCIGVASSVGSASDIGELEQQADRALYQAKADGKGHVRLYDEEIGKKLFRKRALESDFKNALTNSNPYLDFQAVFEAETFTMLGVEALLRWKHPVFGAIPPEEIVSLAKSESMSIQLLEFVLRTAIEEFSRLPFRGFLSININPADLDCDYLADRIMEILDERGFAPMRLWLEITESEALRQSAAANVNLEKLRGAGIKIAIDDFGAGYSSLSRLGTFPADILKIDRELIRNCNAQPGQKVILDSLKTLANIHGLQLVAEGVETKHELDVVRECQVQMLQGFALAKPVPSDHVGAIVSSEDGRVRQNGTVTFAV
ncbi:MAG: EAL domain-containing protein [Pseudomonadota bacterium]